MQCFIGTSGWQYSDWKGIFYPEGLKNREQLAYYAEQFNTVEINSTFYHLPRPGTCANWQVQVPLDFRITVKFNRIFTHDERLVINDDFAAKLTEFLTSVDQIGAALGMLLVQLPPGLKFDAGRLRNFVSLMHENEIRLGRRFPLALEVRNASWFADEAAYKKLLVELGLAHVINSSPNRWPARQWVTGDTIYLRFHGSRELYKSSYTDEELAWWADFIRSSGVQTVYAYFNNDYGGVGLQNAVTLRSMLIG